VVSLGGVPVTSISVARFAADFRPRCFMISMIAYIPALEILRALGNFGCLAEFDEPGVAAHRSAVFQHLPPPALTQTACALANES
jgi:hypothetical protein